MYEPYLYALAGQYLSDDLNCVSSKDPDNAWCSDL